MHCMCSGVSLTGGAWLRVGSCAHTHGHRVWRLAPGPSGGITKAGFGNELPMPAHSARALRSSFPGIAVRPVAALTHPTLVVGLIHRLGAAVSHLIMYHIRHGDGAVAKQRWGRQCVAGPLLQYGAHLPHALGDGATSEVLRLADQAR